MCPALVVTGARWRRRRRRRRCRCRRRRRPTRAVCWWRWSASPSSSSSASSRGGETGDGGSDGGDDRGGDGGGETKNRWTGGRKGVGRRMEKNAKAPARTALRRGTIRGDECLLYLSVTGVP